jgi:tubulin-specific chaperone A
MESKAVLRHLKIKTGSLKRNTKDYTSYATEIAQLKEKVEKLKAENVDESKITSTEREVADTLQMLPNSKTRIENALEELQGLMSEHEGNEEIEAAEEWTVAKAQVEESAAFAETI